MQEKINLKLKEIYNVKTHPFVIMLKEGLRKRQTISNPLTLIQYVRVVDQRKGKMGKNVIMNLPQKQL